MLSWSTTKTQPASGSVAKVFSIVGGEVLVGAALSYGGGYDPARGHLEVGDQAPATVANVLVLLKLAASFARLHRKGRMETLQSLDGGLLVGGDHMHALLIA